MADIYQIQTFTDEISIWLGEAKIDGLLLTRKAVYRVLTDNRDTKSLSLAGYIEYYNQDKELVSIIPRKPFELIADTNHFVLNKDGSYIGDISELNNAYGIIDTETQIVTGYSVPIISEYEFYLEVSAQPVSVRELILSAMVRSETLKNM